MKESQPLPAIAVSLATSLVAAPYLLIRNDYHKKVAPLSKGAYALHDFILLWGLEDFISLPALVSKLKKSFLLSLITKKVSFIAPTYTKGIKAPCIGCWIRDPRSRLDQHPAERGQSLEATGWETKRTPRVFFSSSRPRSSTKRGISIMDPMINH